MSVTFLDKEFESQMKNRILPLMRINLEEGYFKADDGAKIHYGYINNPNANRNTITRRYAGKNVTQDRIFQIIRQYPDGIGGTFPLFDDLVFGRGYGSQDDYSVMDGDAAMSNNDFGGGMSQMSSRQNQDAAVSNSEEQLTCVIVVIIFLICKLGLHLGWIASILIGLLGGGILTAMIVGEK